MSANTHNTRHSGSLQSTKGKVIAGFALAGVALLLFWLGNRFVLGVALRNMETLSRPNEKLMRVHTLFQEFTRTDQLQRHMAIQSPAGRREKIQALSDSLRANIAVLQGLYLQTDDQFQRLDSIQQVLERRERLFWVFIRQRDALLSGKVLAEYTQTISELIAGSTPQLDSSRQVNTYRQITKTSAPPDTVVKIVSIERPGGFFNRLFGKKKPSEVEEHYLRGASEVSVEEVLDSVVNVLALSKKDTILPELEHQLRGMFRTQQEQATRTAWAELSFLKAGNMLTNEILSLLYEIEDTELRVLEADRNALSKLIHDSYGLSNSLLIGILLCLAGLIYFILTDFSNSRKFRTELVRAKEEAEYLSRVKERFLSNMSHEIRTPLQSIVGYAEQIQKHTNPAASDKQAIHQSARHLLQIVNEVLDYSRLVSGRFQLEPRPFSLREVFDEVCAVMQVQAADKGLAFQAEMKKAPDTWLLGDAFRLRQILYNLLGNAIKFTDKGRVSLLVEAHRHDNNWQVGFCVEDTGIGISEEGLGYIFNQFEQAPGLDRERYGGTGLGLSIVKALVELQDGEIRATSTPGRGSKFVVSLSFPEAAAASAVADNPQHAPEYTAPHSGAIWLVDDDALTLRLCTRILRDRQYQVTAFSSAADLLDTATIRPEDLVVTDINLAGQSGYDLLRVLRRQVPGLAVVAMTAQALPDERQALHDAGFDAVLVKPFSETDLLGTVAGLVKPATDIPQQGPEATDAPDNTDTEELEELFAATMRSDLHALDAALEADDALAAANLLHRLAGRCGQFGHTDRYAALRALEVQLRAQPDLEPIRETCQNLIRELRAAPEGGYKWMS